jgi:hypothetical protein
MNFLVTLGLLSIMQISFCSQVNAKAWGANPLSEKYRPNRNWINQFSTSPDVIATGSITDAIDSCDEIVGKRKHCVVKVGNLTNGFPLEINRSKTKLLGMEGMAPIGSRQNGAFISIGNNIQQVVIEGINLQGHRAGNEEIFGIIVEGKNIKKIMIFNNEIHDFNSDNNAHGIAVYGRGKNNREGVRDVIIDGNKIYSMRTGSSESVVVNGNVRRWEITNNDIYDVNNIAIDAIGGEGTSAARIDRKGRILPGKFDAACYGFIEDNFVENMSTLNNPAYGNIESWAAAIYVDGGHHIKITDNVVVNSAWGYEVGAENCLVSRHITLTGNSAKGSTFGDLLLGGYAETGYRANKDINCDPNNTVDANEGHGYVRYLTAKDNIFNSIGTKLDLITLQFRISHSIVIDPNITPENESGNGSASGDDNAIRTNE